MPQIDSATGSETGAETIGGPPLTSHDAASDQALSTPAAPLAPASMSPTLPGDRGAGQGNRSSRREVRNPVLGLPAAKLALVELTTDERSRVRRVMLAIRDDARGRAAECWRRHKAPMAVYWKCVGVYTNHIARVLA